MPTQCDPNRTYWTAVLLSVPALLRLTQCVRRWVDSKYTQRIHLVNAAKYSTSVLQFFFYIRYRFHGSSRNDDLALWIVFGIIYSVYTSAWDLLMDWSVLRPRASKPLLREELVFEDWWPFYYFAMVRSIAPYSIRDSC